jgi:hypothetical protein
MSKKGRFLLRKSDRVVPTLRDMEIESFRQALLRFVNLCGTKTEAARRLSISRSTLDRWLDGYIPDLERLLVACDCIHYNLDCRAHSRPCPFPKEVMNRLDLEDWQKMLPIAEALVLSKRR